MGYSLSFRSAFCAFLIFGGLGLMSLYDVVDGPGSARQERQAQTPEWPQNPRAALRFIADARFHIKERYALKDAFVSLNSAIKINLFGHSDTSNVTLGQSGFLFLNETPVWDLLQGQNRLDPRAEDAWGATFAALSKDADHLGVPYALILSPNKHSVYSELLPNWVRAAAIKDRRTFDILEQAQAHLDPAPMELTSYLTRLRKLQPDLQLYHQTDTHWNEAGATSAVAHALEAILPFDLVTAEFIEQPALRSGDLARMLGRQSAIQESDWAYADANPWRCHDPSGALVPIETIDPLLPQRFGCNNPLGHEMTVVVFIDSFGVSALPFLADTFQRVEVFWQDQVDFQNAAMLQGDLVIQVIVERKFNEMKASDFYDFEITH